MATLAELRASKPDPESAPTRTYRLCLDHSALADVQRLEGEKNDLLIEALRGGEQEGQKRRKMAEGAVPPRVAEIDAELEAAYDKMRAAEGVLRMRPIPGGEWQRWKDEHPARKDNEADLRVTYGRCNATDLMDILGRFAVEWEGEPLAESDWAGVMLPRIAPADLPELCTLVVEMHEAPLTLPKSPRPSPPSQSGETG